MTFLFLSITMNYTPGENFEILGKIFAALPIYLHISLLTIGTVSYTHLTLPTNREV